MLAMLHKTSIYFARFEIQNTKCTPLLTSHLSERAAFVFMAAEALQIEVLPGTYRYLGICHRICTVFLVQLSYQ